MGDPDSCKVSYNCCTGFTGVSSIVAEYKPMLGIIQLISGRCFQLLHVVEHMRLEDDTPGSVGLEEKLSIYISCIHCDLTALGIEKTECSIAQGMAC